VRHADIGRGAAFGWHADPHGASCSSRDLQNLDLTVRSRCSPGPSGCGRVRGWPARVLARTGSPRAAGAHLHGLLITPPTWTCTTPTRRTSSSYPAARAPAPARRAGHLAARAAPRASRLAPCARVSFLLAEAGLHVDGRRVTTHWGYADTSARRHPEVEVTRADLHPGRELSTSAGVTGRHRPRARPLAEDLGHDAALAVARGLVVFLRRPGNQSQFTPQLAAQTAHREPLREVQRGSPSARDADLSGRRWPTARTCRRGSSPARSRRGRHAAGPLRRTGAPGAARRRSRQHRRHRGDRQGLRLRHARGDAQRRSCCARTQPAELPPRSNRRHCACSV